MESAADTGAAIQKANSAIRIDVSISQWVIWKDCTSLISIWLWKLTENWSVELLRSELQTTVAIDYEVLPSALIFTSRTQTKLINVTVQLGNKKNTLTKTCKVIKFIQRQKSLQSSSFKKYKGKEQQSLGTTKLTSQLNWNFYISWPFPFFPLQFQMWNKQAFGFSHSGFKIYKNISEKCLVSSHTACQIFNTNINISLNQPKYPPSWGGASQGALSSADYF